MTAADRDRVLKAFADSRGRPAVFFFADPLGTDSVVSLQEQLQDRELEELDLVIHSGGGNVHAAYQAMTLLRRHAKRIHACVPFRAKGAATLMCIGADTIVLGENAELGPLDAQIWEEEKRGKGEYHSALDRFKALEQMQSLSEGALSLVGKLDPERIGQYGRELAVAGEYARRLMGRLEGSPPGNIDEVVDQLVYGYPSHEYVIDRAELEELGFEVERFSPAHRGAVADLRKVLDEAQADRERSIIRLVNPSRAQPEPVGVDSIAARPVTPMGNGEMATTRGKGERD